MSVRLNPYVNFRGNAREAMTFYQQVLGGELRMSTFEEFGAAQEPSDNKLIIHAQLEGGDGDLWLMGSDVPERMPYQPGTNSSSISLSGEDEDTLTRYFDGLAQGGQILQPLTKAQWGDSFGMVTDKFGLTWLVNISAPRS
jgi:PhnB protein